MPTKYGTSAPSAPRGSGKFENALDEAMYELSLDGGPDEEAGSSSEAPGLWAGVMRSIEGEGGRLADAIEDRRDDFPNVTDADLKWLSLNGRAGVILTENDQGFVGVKYYGSRADLDHDWREIVEFVTIDDDTGEPYESNGVIDSRAIDRLGVPPSSQPEARLRWANERLRKLQTGKLSADEGKLLWQMLVGWADVASDADRQRYYALAKRVQAAGDGRLRPNSTISERRARGEINGLTKAEMDSMEIRIPTFDWKQIGGDMNPGSSGGTIATADGDAIALIKIQPVRDSVGDREAAEVGYPFWSREANYDLDDLSLTNEDVQSAIESMDLGQHLLDMDPEQRALAIAEACMDYGVGADEGPSGWARDVLGRREVEWWGSNGKREGYEYIADEDDEFRREVLNQYEVRVDGAADGWYDEEDDAIEAAEAQAKVTPSKHVEVLDSQLEVVWDSEGDDGEGGALERNSSRRFRPVAHKRNASPGKYLSITKIKAANKAAGYHFFDADTLRFWSSHIDPKVYGGRYFVTSEQFSEEEPRLFSVREADATGRVRTVDQRLSTKAEAVSRIADLLSAHTPNPRRYPVLMSGNEPMSQLLDMQAESMDPSGRGDVPDEVRGELSYTDNLIRVVTEYDDALAQALEDVVEKYPPKDDASAVDLFDDEAPYLVLMTLMGHGVGIWDGSWDEHYDSSDIEKVQALLEKRLGRYANSSGSGKIVEAMEDAVWEAMRNAGYTIDDEAYVKLDEGESPGYEYQDTELSPERVEEIVTANAIPTPKFWDAAGARRPLTRGEVDRLVKQLGGRYARNPQETLRYEVWIQGDYHSDHDTSELARSAARDAIESQGRLATPDEISESVIDTASTGRLTPNMSRDARWHVFLNDELMGSVYMPPAATKSEVKAKLIREGYDPRIEVDQPPARRTDIPPHYRTTLRANRKWSRAHMNDLPDSAFLYIEPGGREDEHGRTTPRTLRHFPYRNERGKVDLAHLRNALSRIPQAHVPEGAKRAARAQAEKLLAEHGG